MYVGICILKYLDVCVLMDVSDISIPLMYTHLFKLENIYISIQIFIYTYIIASNKIQMYIYIYMCVYIYYTYIHNPGSMRPPGR